MNVLTPYWLTLSLNGRERVSLPIFFGEKQRRRIEETFRGEWQFTTVEMVKRDGYWYAHFALKNAVEVPDDLSIVTAIERGEHNLAVAVAISESNPNKPIRGRFWRGEEIKRIRRLYAPVRRKLQEKRRVGKVKELEGKERRKVNQQLHIIANQIIAYAKQFYKPLIVMGNLNEIRGGFKRSKRLNRRLHSLTFRKLQTIMEYRALLEGIEVKYLTKKRVRGTSKTCHRCGHVAREHGREMRCLKCGLRYNRDLNACINIAHALTKGMGWGSASSQQMCGGVKPSGERWKPRPSKGGVAHSYSQCYHHFFPKSVNRFSQNLRCKDNPTIITLNKLPWG